MTERTRVAAAAHEAGRALAAESKKLPVWCVSLLDDPGTTAFVVGDRFVHADLDQFIGLVGQAAERLVCGASTIPPRGVSGRPLALWADTVRASNYRPDDAAKSLKAAVDAAEEFVKQNDAKIRVVADRLVESAVMDGETLRKLL